VGLNLDSWVKKNLLQFHSTRATFYGLETHLVSIHKLVQEFHPQLVVLDPISSLEMAGTGRDANSALIRVIDFLKMQGITAVLIDLSTGGKSLERTELGVSSLVDSWLLLRDIELSGERNRAMYVLKSRGMAHSNQVREFVLTDHGVELLDVYVGPEGVLTGSSRLSQEARERAAETSRRQELERKQRERIRKREALEARIVALRKEFEAEDEEAERLVTDAMARDQAIAADRVAIARSRKADSANLPEGRRVPRSRNGKANKVRRTATS
jgi:circadian clock protein KaiC